MALNPSIILAGRSPDVVNALASSTQAAQMGLDLRHQQGYRNALSQYGAGAYQGDEAARAQLAAFDPLAMQGMGQTDLAMDATRLGMDATRQQMRILDDQNARAAAEAMRASNAAAVQAEMAQLDSVLSGAMIAQTTEEWDAFVMAQGADELVGQFDNRQALAAMRMDLGDIYAQTFAAPVSPADRYQTVTDVGLVDLMAEGGPAAIITPQADGTTDREMREDQNGVLRYVDTQEPVFPSVKATPAAPDLGSAADLRGEFTSNPVVKNFIVQNDAFARINATAQNPSAAGDLAMIFSFMKLLDPASVVREQEFANAQNAAGVPDQVRNLYNRILSGERLNPEQRADFLGQAETVYTAALGQYTQIYDSFAGIAQRAGLPLEDALIDYRPQAPSSPAQPAAAVAPSASADMSIDDLLNQYAPVP